MIFFFIFIFFIFFFLNLGLCNKRCLFLFKKKLWVRDVKNGTLSPSIPHSGGRCRGRLPVVLQWRSCCFPVLHCNACCRAVHRLLWSCRAMKDLHSLHPTLQGRAQLAPGVATPCTTHKQCCRAVQRAHPLLLGHAGPATCAAGPCKVWSLRCRATHCFAPGVAGPCTTGKQRCSTTQSLHPMLLGYARFASGAAGLCRTCNHCCRTLQNWHPMLQGHAQLAPGAAVPCGMDKQCLQGHAKFAPCAAGLCRVCIQCFRICTQHCRVAQNLHPALQGHEGFAAMLQHAPCRPYTQHHTGPTALPPPSTMGTPCPKHLSKHPTTPPAGSLRISQHPAPSCRRRRWHGGIGGVQAPTLHTGPPLSQLQEEMATGPPVP